MNVPSNVIMPLGLSQVDACVNLIYRSKRRGQKLAVARGKIGELLQEQPGAPLLVSSSGSHINEEEIRRPMLVEIGDDRYITYSIKVGANWQWRIARNTPDWDLSLWETLPSNLNITQGLLVSDSLHDSDNALAVYVQSDILHIAESKNMSRWDTLNAICSLPYRAQLIAATEHPLGIVVVYAHQVKRGRKRKVFIHAVLIDRDELHAIEHRKNISTFDANADISEALIGAVVADKALSLYALDKKNQLQKYNIPLNLYRNKQSTTMPSHNYTPQRPELVEILQEPEPIQPTTGTKVLMFGWELPPHHKGGLGVATYGLAKSLIDHGAQIQMILPRKKPISDDSISVRFAGVESIKITHIDSLLQPYLSAQQYEEIRAGKGMGYAQDLHAEVKRYTELAVDTAKELDFDVIHTHDWLTIGAGAAVKRATGKPLIAHIHSTSKDMAGGGEVDKRIWQAEHDGLQVADRIIAVSQHTKNTLVKLHDIDPDRIEVVYNGIDCRSYSPDQFALERDTQELKFNHSAYKTVLFVGRLTRHKGPEQFLNMAANVLRLRPHTHFVFGGTGDQEHRLIDLAASLGISANVHFAGWVSGKDLTRLYRSADLYILPSVSEPFGITPLESIINGTPVLVSKQSGVSEVLHSALKADFWDVNAMTEQTIAALDYPWLHRQLSEKGLDEVRNLTWRKAAENTIEVYHNTLNQYGAYA